MESLGGDRLWLDRFIGVHAAIVYYWLLVMLWLFSPTYAVSDANRQKGVTRKFPAMARFSQYVDVLIGTKILIHSVMF
jgi:hypothetical protein